MSQIGKKKSTAFSKMYVIVQFLCKQEPCSICDVFDDLRKITMHREETEF